MWLAPVSASLRVPSTCPLSRWSWVPSAADHLGRCSRSTVCWITTVKTVTRSPWGAGALRPGNRIPRSGRAGSPSGTFCRSWGARWPSNGTFCSSIARTARLTSRCDLETSVGHRIVLGSEQRLSDAIALAVEGVHSARHDLAGRGTLAESQRVQWHRQVRTEALANPAQRSP